MPDVSCMVCLSGVPACPVVSTCLIWSLSFIFRSFFFFVFSRLPRAFLPPLHCSVFSHTVCCLSLVALHPLPSFCCSVALLLCCPLGLDGNHASVSSRTGRRAVPDRTSLRRKGMMDGRWYHMCTAACISIYNTSDSINTGTVGFYLRHRGVWEGKISGKLNFTSLEIISQIWKNKKSPR